MSCRQLQNRYPLSSVSVPQLHQYNSKVLHEASCITLLSPSLSRNDQAVIKTTCIQMSMMLCHPSSQAMLKQKNQKTKKQSPSPQNLRWESRRNDESRTERDVHKGRRVKGKRGHAVVISFVPFLFLRLRDHPVFPNQSSSSSFVTNTNMKKKVLGKFAVVGDSGH